MAIEYFTFTKFDAARRQLKTAIELWFVSGDPVSTHSLAYSSHEIIYRLFRNRGLSGLSYDVSGITEEQRKEMAISLKNVPNFFKHANQETEPDATITLNPADTMFFLTLSVTGLLRMGYKLQAHEHALMFWTLFHFPDWFPEDVQESCKNIEALDEVRAVEKHRFLEMFLKVINRNPKLSTWFGGVTH